MPRHRPVQYDMRRRPCRAQSEGSASLTGLPPAACRARQKYMSPDRSCKMQQIKALTTIKASDGSCWVATCKQVRQIAYTDVSASFEQSR